MARVKLLTKEIEENLPQLYSTEGQKDPMVSVKFFNPTGIGTWFGIEYNPEDKLFYGLIDMNDYEPELGYFSLEELESIRLPLGLSIERDLYFTPKTLSEVRENIKNC